MAERRDAARHRVDPAHRHLCDPIATLPGAIKDLDVEGDVAFELHLREDLTRDLATPELEAALGIPNPGQYGSLDQEVESLAHQHSMDRLRDLDARRSLASGGDRDVRAVHDRAAELLQLVDRRRQIRIRNQDELALALRDATRNRRALATVAGLYKHPDPFVVARRLLGRMGGSVAAAVVDDDELPRHSVSVEVATNRVDRQRKPCLLIEGGNHDREPRPSGHEVQRISAAPARASRKRVNPAV